MHGVAIYCRVSTDDQAERKTIDSQVEFAQKYCDLHQLPIAKWYKDDGITGTLPLQDRPEGSRLLEDAAAGAFDTVLVYKLDRLGRSARVILNAVYELEQHGVKVKSMTEPFDTGDPSGRFLLTILAGVADLERENILSRMWHGANRAAREGKWLGGIVPYGYTVNDDGYLEVSETNIPGFNLSEADVVRFIYSMVGERGYSTVEVADQLNAMKIPPRYVIAGRKIKRGKRKVNTAGVWRPARIRNMIVNSTYMGKHRYGKRSKKNRQVIERKVPAIVTEELWEKAQQTLRENRIEAIQNKKYDYLLSGLIRCGTCGMSYHGAGYTNGKRGIKRWYRCGGKTAYRGPLKGKCNSRNVGADWLEELVWNDCVNFIQNPGEAIKQLSDSMNQRKSRLDELEKEMELLRRAIDEKDNERQRVLTLFRKDLITATEVEKQLDDIATEKSKLQDRLTELEKQSQREATLDKQFRTAEQLLLNLQEKLKGKLSFEEKRQIVKTLVDEILVVTEYTEGSKRANVHIKYSFSQAVLHTDKGS